jgi:hypothetical protein
MVAFTVSGGRGGVMENRTGGQCDLFPSAQRPQVSNARRTSHAFPTVIPTDPPLPSDAQHIALYGTSFATCGLIRWLYAGVMLHG